MRAISFIGMSGMGKSYRSNQLKELGFTTYCCDDEIAKKITTLLPTEDVTGLAAWMGHPYALGYKDREKQYLELEELVTQQGIEELSENCVLDTTGSVVYLSDAVLKKLREKSTVVYLESSQEVRDKLFEVYMRDPKPIVWGNSYIKNEGEGDYDALKRCYPELLNFRAGRYQALAHVTLPYTVARNEHSIGTEFLEIMKSKIL